MQAVFRVKTWQQNVWPQGDRRMGAYFGEFMNSKQIGHVLASISVVSKLQTIQQTLKFHHINMEEEKSCD